MLRVASWSCAVILSLVTSPGLVRAQADGPVPAGAPTTEAGGFQISVLRVRPAVGDLQIRLQVSALKSNAQSFEVRGPGGFAGGAAGGGGTGGGFLKPNLAIDVIVSRPQGKSLSGIVEVSSHAKAIDDTGGVLDSPKLDRATTLQMSDDPRGLGRGTMLFSTKNAQAKSLKSVEGELVVTPGTIATADFRADELHSESTKKVGSRSVRVSPIKTTDDGVELTVAMSMPSTKLDPRQPQQFMKQMQQAQDMMQVAIRGSDQKTYPPAGQTASGGAATSGGFSSGFTQSFGTAGGGAGTASGFGAGSTGNRTTKGKKGQGETANFLPANYRFPPLPEGVTLQSVEVTITDRTGEPQRILFKLSNVPLQFPNG